MNKPLFTYRNMITYTYGFKFRWACDNFIIAVARDDINFPREIYNKDPDLCDEIIDRHVQDLYLDFYGCLDSSL